MLWVLITNIYFYGEQLKIIIKYPIICSTQSYFEQNLIFSSDKADFIDTCALECMSG